ncbi:hypothetical protein DENSPDRAFT_885572 [Dentipellis sp. KUC8613]|nr:hypothetical protein DENSPDRAFT_885572 [Dentipellis sp. KUC8613]
MARTTSFATFLTLLLFLVFPCLLSVPGPLAVRAAVTEPAFGALHGGIDTDNLAARLLSLPKKPPTAPPAKPSTVPAKAPLVKIPSAAPVKATSAAPVKAASTAPVKALPVAPLKVTSSPPAEASVVPVKASSPTVKVSALGSIVASTTATSEASASVPSAASSVTLTGASPVVSSKAAAVSTSIPATGASASTSASSAAACAVKRAGTSGVAAAAECGTCDPCDDACDTNTQELSTRRRAVLPEDEEPQIRTVYGNDTSPFFPGEHVRIRIIEKRDTPVLEFDCSPTGIPDVCQNMCYGVYCRYHPKTLTRNTADKSTCAAARKRNSCGVSSPNRCSAGFTPAFAAGHSCDEYPFASTMEGQYAGTEGRPEAVTRCVPAGQNRSQGGKISGIYQRAGASLANKVPQKGTYDIEFDFGSGSPQGYCVEDAKTTTCGTLTGSQQDN